MKKYSVTKGYAGYKEACELLNGKDYDEAMDIITEKGWEVTNNHAGYVDFWVNDYAIVTYCEEDKAITPFIDLWADDRDENGEFIEVGDGIKVLDPEYIWEE